MKALLLIILMGAVSGCSTLGVPASLCDVGDDGFCRAEYAAERTVNTGVEYADERVCVDINFYCSSPPRDPDCLSYCQPDPGAGDRDIKTLDAAAD